MLRIWGRNNSLNVQKVLWCCEELGTKYERVDVGGPHGGLDTPEYLRLNPNGLIPTLEEDGFVLWESNAIVRYLATHEPGSGLLPTNPAERAHAEQWMDWQLSTLNPPFVTLFLGLVRTPAERRDHDAIDKAHARVTQAWTILDAYLDGRRFVLGDGLTIADIPLGVCAYRWFNMPVDSPPLTNIRAWYETLTQRPAYRKAVMLPVT